MAKKLSDILAERANASLKKHHDAVQEVDFDEGRRHQMISIDQIDPNPYQPRRVFDEAKLKSLAESIKQQGLIHPIRLRMIESGRYQIVAGERRWRAIQLNGERVIEAIVAACSDDDMAINAMTENIARDDLTDFEKALQIKMMLDRFGDSKTALAASLGMERSDLYRYMAFFDLPSASQALLNEHPTLLSRRFAEEVKKAIAHSVDKDLSAQCLQEGLGLIQAGLMDQSALPAHVAVKPTAKAALKAKPSNVSTFVVNKKSVGNLQIKGKQLVLALPAKLLDSSDQQQLVEFVQSLLANKKAS